jgi:hypothetical protein
MFLRSISDSTTAYIGRKAKEPSKEVSTLAFISIHHLVNNHDDLPDYLFRYYTCYYHEAIFSQASFTIISPYPPSKK